MGLSGQPCQQPLSKEIVPERLPFILIRATGELYIDFKHFITVLLKPKRCRTRYKNSHRTESKAFSASKLIAKDFVFPLLIICNRCIARLTLSCVRLFLTKPVWSVSIRSGIIFSSVLTIIEMKIL